jgi:hypothetical protein
MVRLLRWSISLVLLLGFCVVAQAQDTYLDEYIVHVKPDKRAAFDAATKKMVAANRSGQGDTWVALESVYGDSDTIRLVSTRASFADIDKASATFEAAMEKAMGRPAMEKLFEDFGSVATESRGLLIRRRPDLSVNMPADPAAQAKIVGGSRWVRIVRIVVRIGMGPRFEELAKQVKAAEEKTSPNVHSWISQSVAGDRASVYYVAELQPSLAGFDGSPSLAQMMGGDAYQALLKTASEVIQTEEITLERFVPSLSNPPAATVEVAPDFWNPKPAAPKAAATKPAAKAPAKTTP